MIIIYGDPANSWWGLSPKPQFQLHSDTRGKFRSNPLNQTWPPLLIEEVNAEIFYRVKVWKYVLTKTSDERTLCLQRPSEAGFQFLRSNVREKNHPTEIWSLACFLCTLAYSLCNSVEKMLKVVDRLRYGIHKWKRKNEFFALKVVRCVRKHTLLGVASAAAISLIFLLHCSVAKAGSTMARLHPMVARLHTYRHAHIPWSPWLQLWLHGEWD